MKDERTQSIIDTLQSKISVTRDTVQDLKDGKLEHLADNMGDHNSICRTQEIYNKGVLSGLSYALALVEKEFRESKITKIEHGLGLNDLINNIKKDNE